MLHISNTSLLYCKFGTAERIHLYYKNKWITRSKRAFLLRLPAEDAVCELDDIECSMFWKHNDTCNVYMLWLGLSIMWFSVLYQMINFLSGTFWDKSYVIAICTMFVGAMILCNVDPIYHPPLHS